MEFEFVKIMVGGRTTNITVHVALHPYREEIRKELFAVMKVVFRELFSHLVYDCGVLRNNIRWTPRLRTPKSRWRHADVKC